MPTEIIIVDDDPLVGDLSSDLLSGVGYATHVIRDSNLVMDAVREQRPKLVILDILMPGIDGLTLLHTIKNDAELSSTRVAVVSGKSFAPEIERAMEYGAELFIQKPYDVKEFSQQVGKLIGPPDSPNAEEGGEPTPVEQEAVVRLRVWGGAEPDSAACVAVEALGELFILDAGKGIIPLGEKILEEKRFHKAWILISHFHEEQISGLGLFPCLREKGFQLRIAGPREPDKSLADMLRERIKLSFSQNPAPVTAQLRLHELKEEVYEVRQGVRIAPFYANHPGTTLGFVLELGGRRLVYSPDSELYGEAATALQDYDEKTGRIVRGADLLIHDARYNDEDHPAHLNEGHSALTCTVNFATEQEVKRLLLFHPDPSYSPEALEAMEKQAVHSLEENGSAIPCRYARDGVELEF